MESKQEIPECPVCLTNYNGKDTIPRVLTCGHTTCESCLKNLPQKYPQTVRCPACTQLVKLPSQGPSFLPKNIDLLRLINPTNDAKKPTNSEPSQAHDRHQVDSCLCSDEFYVKWKNWVIEKDAVLVEDKEKDTGFLKDWNKEVRIFKVGDCLFDVKESDFVFKVSYVARVMNFLYEMRDVLKEELCLILSICVKNCCKVFGFWADVGNGCLYLIFERLNEGGFDHFGCFENGKLCRFSVMGMEICEALVGLHLEGLSLGCLSLSCFELDDFGHVFLSLSEVLLTGRIVHEVVAEICSVGRKISVKEMRILISELFKREVFVSPKVLLDILKKDGIEFACDCDSSIRFSVGNGTDVWSLACIFLRLIIGKHLVEELVDYVNDSVLNVIEENSLDFSGFYAGLVEKVSSLLNSELGVEFESLQQILCRCLNLDPNCQPLVIDVWKCVRELIVKPEFDIMHRLDKATIAKTKGHFLVLGELCSVPKKISEMHDKDEVLGSENNSSENVDRIEGTTSYQSFVDGLLQGKVKLKNIQGHLDCVTGLASGEEFLFSSSFDKSVQVWSLQDFSHVHTFKGHEHKVMAVIYVNEEQPLCISGDSGGGIFLWSITLPLKQEPLKKWYEEKDWRYSGIHALTIAGNGYLYTGSGDRLVKVWSLQDGTLSSTMNGHKSVVSSLAASDGVLYSGSWDGSIRLWSLTDHSPLTVLGEDLPGTMTSVLSLIACQTMLVAAHENGYIKVWKDDKFMKSMQLHNGAIFAAAMEGNYVFTGGWDKTVHVQELLGDEFHIDARSIGSIPGVAVVTSLMYQQGKLFVAHGDRTIKVYYYGE